MLSETRALLLAWRPGEPAPAFTERVLRDDVLGKASARTVKEYVRAFARRFLTPDDQAARYMQRLVAGVSSRQVFSDLAFHYTARQDRLLRDFTALYYWPAVREGRLSISIDDVRHFIWEAEQDGRIAVPWTAGIKRDMPARVLNALADFGLLGSLRSGRRQILPYRPADGTVAYLAHLLHFEDTTDASLAEHSAWALFGLEPTEMWARLEILAGEGWYTLQRAGQVVRITWIHQSMEEIIDALA